MEECNFIENDKHRGSSTFCGKHRWTKILFLTRQSNFWNLCKRFWKTYFLWMIFNLFEYRCSKLSRHNAWLPHLITASVHRPFSYAFILPRRKNEREILIIQFLLELLLVILVSVNDTLVSLSLQNNENEQIFERGKKRNSINLVGWRDKRRVRVWTPW